MCENSLLKNHLQTFEKICEKDNKGNDAEFLNSYLKPFVVLLDSIRSAIEVCSSFWVSMIYNILLTLLTTIVLSILKQ